MAAVMEASAPRPKRHVSPTRLKQLREQLKRGRAVVAANRAARRDVGEAVQDADQLKRLNDLWELLKRAREARLVPRPAA